MAGPAGNGNPTRTASAEIIVRDRTGAGVRSATSNFQQLHTVVRDNWWGIQNLGTAFAGVGALIAGGLGLSVKAAVDFETGMIGVARTTREAGENADQAIANVQGLGEELRNIAKSSPVEVGRLTAIAEEAGALGVARKDVAAFTQTIVQLTATTNLTDTSATQLARIGGVMNITARDVSNMGSAILFAGRSTAATESEIVRFAQYLAPVAASANASAGELIAFSAVLPSLGQRADSARTAISKTIADMRKAIQDGGQEFALFARISGKSMDDFERSVNENGFQATTDFVEGLNRMGVGSAQMEASLAALGIRETRQLQVLRALAAAYDGSADSILRLDNAMEQVEAAFIANEELSEAYAASVSSTAAQFAIFRNRVRDLAIGVGSELLPVIKPFIVFLGNIVEGFLALPGPIKTGIAILVVAAGAIATLAGAVLLLGPKLVLVKGAFIEVAKAQSLFLSSNTAAAGILATNANQGFLATQRLAFGYGRLSAAEQASRLQTLQKAAAQRVANAIHENAILINNAMSTSMALESKNKELNTVATMANARSNLFLAQSNAAAARGNVAAAKSALAKAQAEQAVIASSRAEIAANTAQIASLQGEVAARNAAIAVTIKQIEAENAAALASKRAAVATGLLGKATKALTGPLGILITLLALIPFMMGGVGRAAEDAADKTARLARETAELRKALNQDDGGAAAKQYIFQALAMANAAEVAKRYGLTVEQLYAIIRGQASADTLDKFNVALKQGYADGDRAAGELYNRVVQLKNGVDQHTRAATTNKGVMGGQSDAMRKQTEDARKAKDALDDLRDANNAINQALLSLPQALLAQREAALAVADAQKAYNEALDANKRQAEDVAQAERDLAKARMDQQRAARDVTEAQRDMTRARQRGADKLAEAEDKYADSQDNLYESQQKVIKAEETLNELREGPSADKLRDATNKLADANLKLRDSQLGVRDAQYMLNYLLAEGASARDIEEARLNLDESNQAVANSTDDLIDAQKELNDLENPDPRVIADAERDLASARRDEAEAVREQREAQQGLQDERARYAADTEYRDAQTALIEAQTRQAEAAIATREAEKSLREEQSNVQGVNDAAAAQLALEQALYRQAEANVEVQKQMALSRGEEFGLGREARALSVELGRLGAQAGGQIGKDFAQFAATLAGARADIAETKDDLEGLGEGLGDIGEGMAEDLAGGFAEGLQELDLTGATKGFFSRMFTWFKQGGAEQIATGLVAVLAGALVAVLGAPLWAAAAVAAAVAALIYWIYENREKVADAAERLWDWISKIPGWIGEKLSALGNTVRDNFVNFIVFAVGGVPGAVAKFLWDKFKIGEMLAGIFRRDQNRSNDDGKRSGESVASNLWNGFLNWLRSFFNPRNLLATIFNNQRGQSGQDSSAWGTFLGSMLRGGLLGSLGGLGGAIGGAIRGALSGLPEWIKGPINGAIGLYNGFIERIASMSYNINPVKVLGKTVFPGFSMGFGFMRGLKVNYLADGGILKSTVFAAGEDGPEAVIPLDRLWKAFEPLDYLRSIDESMKAAVRDAGYGTGMSAAGGDTFNIYSDDADALEIAEEVVWKKMVRV